MSEFILLGLTLCLGCCGEDAADERVLVGAL